MPSAFLGDLDLTEDERGDFMRMAEYHGVAALVAWNLLQDSQAVSPEFSALLRDAYESNLRRNLWFTAELVRIFEHLQRNRIRALAYKGPALAQSAYGGVGLRSFSDLDLLVLPTDFARAQQALAEIGYRASKSFSPAIERFWLKHGYECSFDSAAGKSLLELQWSLLPNFYAVDFAAARFSMTDLLDRAVSVLLGGVAIPTLSPEDSLLAIALHGAKHLWARLIWVCDFAEALCAPTIDFDRVIARAQSMGIARILAVSACLAGRMVGAVLPQPISDLIAADRDAAEAAAIYTARLSAGTHYNFESSDYFRQIARLRERASDRWRFFWRLATTPGQNDLDAIALPEALFPLYRLVRAGRLARKVVS